MKTAEDIIISKRFFELNASERDAVKELVSNEDEYEAMRWFLTSTGETFAKEKVEPSSDLKKGVMAHLQQKQTATKTIWLNGVSAFLFPSEKKFYQYPAFQIAAVAVLFVSVVAVYNTSSKMDESLAVNDNQIIQTPEENLVIADERKQPDVTVVPEQPAADQDPAGPLTNSSSTGEGNKFLEVPADMAPGEASYYREMSVAEETKVLDGDKVEIMELENASTIDEVITLSDVSQSGSIFKKNEDAVSNQDKYKDSNDNERNESKRDDDSKLESKTTITSNAPTQSGTTTATEKESDEDKETGGYMTGSAGGVYGETAADSTVANGKPEVEESATKFNINDTKVLKKLIFVVK